MIVSGSKSSPPFVSAVSPSLGSGVVPSSEAGVLSLSTGGVLVGSVSLSAAAISALLVIVVPIKAGSIVKVIETV